MRVHEIVPFDELLARLDGILDRVVRDGAIFLVEASPSLVGAVPAGMVRPDGSVAFAIGPPETCSPVGLVDPEYGWPAIVDVEGVQEAADLLPRRRHHPFLHRDGRLVAVSVMIDELERLRRLREGPADA